MKQIDLREGARRQHRSVALFAIVQCWLRGLDGLVFTRKHLERLLGLERFKETRVKWLQQDLKELFPYQEIYWMDGKLNSFGSLFACRRELAKFLPEGTMTDQNRIEGIPSTGPRIALFKIWPHSGLENALKTFEVMVPFFADAANYDERLLAAYLALLAEGQISPRSLPSLRKDD